MHTPDACQQSQHSYLLINVVTMDSHSRTRHIADPDMGHMQPHEHKSRHKDAARDRQTTTCSAGGASGSSCRLAPAWLRSLAEMISPVDKLAQAGLLQYSSYSITPKAYASPSCTRLCTSHGATGEHPRHGMTGGAVLSAVGHNSPM